MDTVDLKLKQNAHPIYIGEDIMSAIWPYLSSTVAIIVDKVVLDLYADFWRDAWRQRNQSEPLMIAVDVDEANKCMNTVNDIIDQLLEAKLGRDSTLIAFGGGVIGDIAGFVAAIYLRGVDLIQIPTTLLAQVDAAIGGKTGVNHRQGKNLIGAFYLPKAVICDTNWLSSLSDRDYRCGLAEVVKYGLLGDAHFFDWLETNTNLINCRDKAALKMMISRSIKAKVDIVISDYQEMDHRRALLNLGHTFGHAIETLSAYQWRHGEAIAIGLVAAAHLSQQVTGFLARDSQRIIKLLVELGLPTRLQSSLALDDCLAVMALDKKNRQATYRFVVMTEIGKAYLMKVEPTSIKQALRAIAPR